MCGIAGIFHPGTPKPVEPQRIAAMIGAMAHRGPDGDGIWTAPGVGSGIVGCRSSTSKARRNRCRTAR